MRNGLGRKEINNRRQISDVTNIHSLKKSTNMKQAIAAFMLFSATIFAACNSGGSSAAAKDTAATTSTVATDTSKSMMASVKYTCKMHPEVISDTAGKCPKCGMDMVPMTDSMMKMSKDSMMK